MPLFLFSTAWLHGWHLSSFVTCGYVEFSAKRIFCRFPSSRPQSDIERKMKTSSEVIDAVKSIEHGAEGIPRSPPRPFA